MHPSSPVPSSANGVPASARAPRLAILALVAALVLSAAALARAVEPIRIPEFDVVEDVVYGHKDGLALTMDVLTPRENPKGIGVVLVSSGGWKSEKSNVAAENERRMRTEHWIRGLLGGRYTIFLARHGSLSRYRVSEMVADIRRSVKFVRVNAGRFGVDPDRLGVTSGSSGGHLSLMAALTADDGNPDAKDPIERASGRVQAVVAWFPPTDLVNWGEPNGYRTTPRLTEDFLREILGDVDDLEAGLRSISPIEFVRSDSPPILLIHGDADLTVPLQQSEILEARCRELGVPTKLVVQPGGGHTFWSGILEDYAEVEAWFDRYLGAEAAGE